METTITASDWIETCIYIMDQSMYIGARIYPFICGLGLLRTIIVNV